MVRYIDSSLNLVFFKPREFMNKFFQLEFKEPDIF